jgi:Nucleotide modification associated domain 2
MPRVYSYIVRYDIGFAPNPYFGYCTLATCKPDIRQRALPGDWVVGFGSAGNKRAGQLIFAMQVEETLSYDQYWADIRFQSKKPNRSGSLRQQYGDNIYHRTNHSSPWIQEDARHSWDDGSPNLGHVKRDTRAPRVLLSRTFAYYGGTEILVPQYLRDVQGFDVCKIGQGYRVNRPDGVDALIINWASERCTEGIAGEPTDWTR